MTRNATYLKAVVKMYLFSMHDLLGVVLWKWFKK